MPQSCTRSHHLAVLLTIALLITGSLGACGRPADAVSSKLASPSVKCWDDTEATGGKCPELTGSRALEWVLPQRKSGAVPSCTKQSPTDFSPVATANDILVCQWPDSKASLTVNRYPSAALADNGCYSTEDWIVDGQAYGRTGYTEQYVGQGGERWWCYTGLPFVFEFVSAAPDFTELPRDFAFRTPAELRAGHLG